LCFLEQAKDNSIQKLTQQETANRLFSQLLIPTQEEAVTKTLELADRLIQSIPAWLLCCDISKEAVELSFNAMIDKTHLSLKNGSVKNEN
jgi:hypothetical protein